VRVERIRDGLWRWTVVHPEWSADSNETDWPPEVGCVYYEAADATVVIDPLAPAADSADASVFWDALDRDVERRGLPVCVLQTVRFHARSSEAVRQRYGPGPDRAAGVEPIRLGDPNDEHAFLIAEHGALVAGDVLVGGPAGEVRVCPLSWFDEDDPAQRAWYANECPAMVATLAELDVSMVLVSHGTPTLEGGRDALLRAAAHLRVANPQ
jgi:hypothetical protein